MKKNNTFRRAAALVAALSITVSLAAPAFAGTYYIDDGDITIIKNENGSQTIKQQGKEDCTDQVGDETIITTHKKAITTLESDLEGPAAEDSGFGPVVEDNYQPAPPAQPEDAEEPKDADQPEDDDQKNAEESENDEEQKDADRQENTDRKESAEEPEDADRKESADRQAQPQQAAPAAAPAASTPGNGFCKNIITVINNAATALKLTLKDVKIDVSDTGTEDYSKAGKAALSVQGSGDVEIELDGKNELKSGNLKAGLEKNTSEGTLTLKDDNQKAGSLTATGGNWAAGIGGGYLGNGKNITIKGGTVNAAGGDNGGAGIGGGDYGSGEDITITGGTVNAAGGLDGAGIGGGWKGSGKNITITGGTVNAAGGNGGSGIGGGDYGSGEDITIKGGTVNAAGGYGGAGIGGGYEGSGSNVTVSGAAQVTAITGKPDWVGAGATIGSGGNETGGQPVDGDELQADISGLTTTGYIRHMIYNEDGSVKQEWWEYGHLQPDPDTTENPNAPAEGSNGVSLGTPGLHVETLEGSPLPFNAQRQGRTLTVRADTLAARLHGTREALAALREQGVEQIEFVTTLKTTTLSVAELLAEGGSRFALEHNGLVSRQLSAAQAESLKCRMR
ncbi:MAG: hypothetical protein KHX18_08230 [Faecalibacterium prausnitzii]|nr:hypothetical protein [Faecalibacterium prausnitzii]